MNTAIQLTNTDKARIFALYLGCEIVTQKGTIIKNNGLIISSIGAGIPKENSYHLRLKPLFDISDEDAIEVAKIAGIDAENIDKDTPIKRDIEFDHTEVIYWDKTSTEYNEWDYFSFTITPKGECYDHMGCSTNYIEVIDFLRSKGYALPYKGIDLFEAGIALTIS